MKIFSKINSKEYNDKLEKILENKNFDENVKNLLLSMFYKIENGYEDYSMVKYNAIPKEYFMERILNVINELCFEIKIVTPKTKASQILDQYNIVCQTDIDKGTILVYANEEDLLYSLIQMDLKQEEYQNSRKNGIKQGEDTYYTNAIKSFLLRAKCINNSEIIRDFDGWSWNNSINSLEDIEYNLIYQSIEMLGIKIDKNFYSKTYEENLKKRTGIYTSIYVMILTLSAQKEKSMQSQIIKRYNGVFKLLTLMSDRTKFLNRVSEEKRNIVNEIGKIDEIINDKEKIKKEYTYRNSKLENKDKIFSINFLKDMLEKERKQQLLKLRKMNDFLDPKKYIEQKEILNNEYYILKNVIGNLQNVNLKKKSMLNLQVQFLDSYVKLLENNTNNKEFWEQSIYKFRYYCLIPISKRKKIYEIAELEEPIKRAMNIIIDNCIDKEIITNFSNSASLCYNILKYVFITKIIDLREIKIKINKIKEEKYINETQYEISVSIYDSKEMESIYNETIYNLKLLNVKINKKNPLFLK